MPNPYLDFIAESNRIEGILRAPFDEEVAAFEFFMEFDSIGVAEFCALQQVFAPNKPLRDQRGMNVSVGQHVAPAGGPDIVVRLRRILDGANADDDPWRVHVDYEILHPFMDGNGRTGRALWAWMMQRQDMQAFALPFLHRFYYQTLSAQR